MSVFATVGLAWIVFTSLLASVAILYMAYIGLGVYIAAYAAYTRTVVHVGVDDKAMDRTVRDLVDEIERSGKISLNDQHVQKVHTFGAL